MENLFISKIVIFIVYKSSQFLHKINFNALQFETISQHNILLDFSGIYLVTFQMSQLSISNGLYSELKTFYNIRSSHTSH